MKRRTFVFASAATLTLPIVSCKPKKPTPTDAGSVGAPPPAPHDYQFFTTGEIVTLDAVLGRLFPIDDPSGAPSYRDANVGPYIDKQLVLPDFRGLERMMHGGMEFLQTVAVRRFGGTFDSRQPEVQDELLTQFQTGQVKGLQFPQARWFATFHAFALEGYWGDPKYGGNHDEGAWKWVAINPHCAHIHLACGR